MKILDVKGNADENTLKPQISIPKFDPTSESAEECVKDSSFVLTTLMGIKDNNKVIARHTW